MQAGCREAAIADPNFLVRFLTTAIVLFGCRELHDLLFVGAGVTENTAALATMMLATGKGEFFSATATGRYF